MMRPKSGAGLSPKLRGRNQREPVLLLAVTPVS